MQNKRTLTKRRRIDKFHLDGERERWKQKGWTLVKEEPITSDDRGYTYLYFEKQQIFTINGWVDL